MIRLHKLKMRILNGVDPRIQWRRTVEEYSAVNSQPINSLYRLLRVGPTSRTREMRRG
jgi:hypothetical protein